MKWIVLIWFVAMFSEVRAQQTISFEEALNRVEENNRAISSARYGVEAARSEYRAAKGLRAPQVELMGGYTLLQRDVDIDLGGAKGVVTQSIESIINKGVADGLITPTLAALLGDGLTPIKDVDWNYTLQRRNFGFVGTAVTLPIYLGGRINSANRVAELELEGSNNHLDGVESTLITELVERFYGVVLAREVVAVRSSVVEGVRQHLSDALAMESEGVLAHSAILYLEYKLSEAERDYVDAVSQLQIAEQALNTTMQIEGNVTPQGAMFKLSNIEDIEYFKESALCLNPIIVEANLMQSLGQERVNMAKGELLPEVVAMGGASIYSHNLSNIVPRWAVGIGLTVPLFGGFSRQQNHKSAEYKARSIAEMVEKCQEDVLLLVDREYYSLQNSLAGIGSCERSISFAESYYYTTLEGFREGVVSSSDLMDARIALAGARVEYLNALYNHMLYLARLLEVSGLSREFLSYKSDAVIVDIKSIML